MKKFIVRLENNQRIKIEANTGNEAMNKVILSNKAVYDEIKTVKEIKTK